MAFSISYGDNKLKEITVQKKLGGKNGGQSATAGAKSIQDFSTSIVRESKSGKEWVVKTPKNEAELFIELFTGRLVQQLKQYLPPESKDDLVCADLVKVHVPGGGDDWVYGLKQPVQKFKELYCLTGSGTSYQDSFNTLSNVWTSITETAGYSTKKKKP